MKRIFFLILIILIQSPGFTQEVFKQPITTIKGETHVEITGLKNIECDSSLGKFEIKSGSFDINVSGVIDRSSGHKIFISLFADISSKNDFVIFSYRGDRVVQYQTEGIPAGNYSGAYTNSNYFPINIHAKIIAGGAPSCFLVLPVNVYISMEGKVGYEKTFVSGTVYIYKAKSIEERNINNNHLQLTANQNK